MIFTVLKDNDPILLKVSDDVENVSEYAEFVEKLKNTMIAYNGIGIAAPQVGLNKRIIVVMNNKKPIVMFNPKIIKTNGLYVSMEGCLSVRLS